MKNRINFVLTLLAIVLLAAGSTVAQEKENNELKVTSEDELAPVRAIQERIDARLAKPLTELDLEIIMEGEHFFGTQPRGLTWDSDSSRFWFSWKKWDEDNNSTWVYTVSDKKLTRLSDEEAELLPSRWAVWNEDRSKAVWNLHGSLVIYDAKSKKTEPLFSHFKGFSPLRFAAEDKYLLCEYHNNVIAVALSPDATTRIMQLTDIRNGAPKSDEPASASQKWQRAQQLALFDVLKKKHDQREERKAREEAKALKPFYLKGWQAGGMTLSQDLKYLAISLYKRANGNRITEMPDYVTESGYTEVRKIRNKVGDNQGKSALAIVELASGKSQIVDFGLEEREISVRGASWSKTENQAFVPVSANDHKDRWYYILTPETVDDALEVKAVSVFNEHNDAWVNWPRGSGWMPDGKHIYLTSEKTDKAHIYQIPESGGEPVALTSGDFEVKSMRFSRDEKHIYYSASLEGNPFEVQNFRIPLAGGQAEQLTSECGRADALLSPDGKYVASIASSSEKPWEVYLKGYGENGIGQQITDSPSPAFKSWNWIDPEIVHFKARDGVMVPAQIFKPAKPHKNKPAVVFVHGAGYMQDVHRWWRGSSYGRVYCFHHMLADMGYTVLDIDYRGSAGYGAEWRTAIYRHMGGKDFTDQVDGARYLVENHGIDPRRIGLYGGSYGGFMTLMCMFNAPDVFAAGAAMRPVTDWAAYNHGYTSNILNNPQDDPDAYIKSSPIYFAENLKGALLICHGIVDDNVHFQGVVRLVQRLIELRKTNWELAIYPVERHGFVQPSSWVDEYYRIVKLFEENLKNK